jgi:hypothetical protein
VRFTHTAILREPGFAVTRTATERHQRLAAPEG